MADQDQFNDEYEFSDLNEVTPDMGTGTEGLNESHVFPEGSLPVEDRSRLIKRNALIIVGVVVLLMILYKIVGLIMNERKAKTVAIAPPPAITTPSQPIVQTPPPSVVATTPTSLDNTAQWDQKISGLEVSQQSLRSDISNVNDQVSSLNNNLSATNNKIAELTAMISSLNAKLDEQAREMEQFVRRREQRRVKHISRAVQSIKYYIQAVIPGRAWLIASNGATLTVREGTRITGYGIVKLIDPNQGRVLTSSGQVIRFSQDDS